MLTSKAVTKETQCTEGSTGSKEQTGKRSILALLWKIHLEFKRLAQDFRSREFQECVSV